MPDLQQVIFVLPDVEEPDPLAAPLADQSDPALAGPGGDAPAARAGETLQIEIAVAGKATRIEVHPLAVERLVLDRYCGGGWTAVSELQDAIFASLRETYLGGDPAASSLAVSRAVSFNKAIGDAVELLEGIVSGLLLQVAADSLGEARDRVWAGQGAAAEGAGPVRAGGAGR